MQKVLVTGGFGFLGAHLVKHLINKGYHVVVMDLNEPKPNSAIHWLLREDLGSIDFVKGNIIDISAIFHVVKNKGITKIVHAAVINDLDILANNPLLTLKVNVEGTVNILEAARLFDVEKVIISSSISVYAPMKYEPMDENHPVHSDSEGPTLLSYSSSKLSAEAFGLHYWSTYGMDIVSLRFSGIYGFGMHYPMFIKPMVEHAVKMKNIHFDSGADSRRDYTYINDVVKGVILALETPTNKRIYNIATGEPLISAQEISKIIMEIEPKIKVSFGNRKNEIEEMSTKTRGMLSIESAKRDLNFYPEYSIRKGIKDYYDHYKKYYTETFR